MDGRLPSAELPPRAAPPEASEDPPIDLPRAARAVRHSRGLIALLVVAITAIVFVVSATSGPRYRAAAHLVDDATAGTEPADPAAVDRQLSTMRTFATSAAVLNRASSTLTGVPRQALDEVEASVDPATNILAISAVAGDPDAAARIANAVAAALMAEQVGAKQQAAARAQRALAATIARLGSSPAVAPVVDALRARLSAAIADESTATADVHLAEPATPPSSRFAPRPLRSAVLAALAALLIGVLTALARDRLQPRVEDARALGRAVGLPLLAVLLEPPPHASPVRRALAAALGAIERDLRSTGRAGTADRIARVRERAHAHGLVRSVLAAEAEEALGRSVRRALPARSHRVVIVSGISARSGGGYVAGSVASALAQSGRPTLLVRADVRTERAPEPFRTAEWRRRAASANGSRPEPWAVASAQPGLDIGAVRESGDVDDLFARIRGCDYAYVIVHGPAATREIEFRLVARHVRAALLVGRVGRERSADAAHARGALDALGIHALGVVATAGDPAVPAEAGALDQAASFRRRRPREPRAPVANGHGPVDDVETNGRQRSGATIPAPPPANG
jgi:capsular polysaccharide biosynthesis protein/Mrp family chromosome partitioning ATPase